MGNFYKTLFKLIESDENFKKTYHTSYLFNHAINEIGREKEEDKLATALKIIERYDRMYNLLLSKVARTDPKIVDGIIQGLEERIKMEESAQE